MADGWGQGQNNMVQPEKDGGSKKNTIQWREVIKISHIPLNIYFSPTVNNDVPLNDVLVLNQTGIP